jgi:hypothetical protein
MIKARSPPFAKPAKGRPPDADLYSAVKYEDDALSLR